MVARLVRFCVIALLGAMTAGPALADEPWRFAPSSPWNIDYSDDSCRLARRFGEGYRSTILVFDRYEPGDEFRLTIISNLVRYARNRADAAIRFGLEPAQDRLYLTATTNRTPTLIFSGVRVVPLTEEEEQLHDRLTEEGRRDLFDPEPIDPGRVAAVDSLFLDVPGLPSLVLETGSLEDPFEAFDTCIDELLTHWGIDVERHRNLSRRAMPIVDPGTWITDSDYPRDMLRSLQQGLVQFRLSIDAEGRPTDCHIQQSMEPAGFDELSCRLILERAAFAPALDADGEPLASYYISSVRFQIGY